MTTSILKLAKSLKETSKSGRFCTVRNNRTAIREALKERGHFSFKDPSSGRIVRIVKKAG